MPLVDFTYLQGVNSTVNKEMSVIFLEFLRLYTKCVGMFFL
jgi:hypothetical protein